MICNSWSILFRALFGGVFVCVTDLLVYVGTYVYVGREATQSASAFHVPNNPAQNTNREIIGRVIGLLSNRNSIRFHYTIYTTGGEAGNKEKYKCKQNYTYSTVLCWKRFRVSLEI